MTLGDILSLRTCKDGDELCDKTTEILKRFGISMLNEDGSYKDTHTLLCEIAEVWNGENKG